MEPTELIILDGGMGTQLQAAGLPMGQAPELWNVTEPEKVTAVHRRYVEAGSKVLYTNTFGVNRLKTARIGRSVRELVEGGVRCARAAAGTEEVRVALDIGPLRPGSPEAASDGENRRGALRPGDPDERQSPDGGP